MAKSKEQLNKERRERYRILRDMAGLSSKEASRYATVSRVKFTIRAVDKIQEINPVLKESGRIFQDHRVTIAERLKKLPSRATDKKISNIIAGFSRIERKERFKGFPESVDDEIKNFRVDEVHKAVIRQATVNGKFSPRTASSILKTFLRSQKGFTQKFDTLSAARPSRRRRRSVIS